MSAVLCLSFLAPSTRAADKKDDKKPEPPTIATVSAVALLQGSTTTLKLRGKGLADASAVKVTAAGADLPATIKSKGKSDPPKPFEAARAGDTELQFELKIPPDLKADAIEFVVESALGKTERRTIPLLDPKAVVAEKEPNNGFKTAQDLPPGKTVLGAIQDEKDVDVYKIGGKAGAKIVAEIVADRRGSLLDAGLTLYDAAGHVLATADDDGASRDPVLCATLPSEGVYYLAVIDANDRGGATHPYQLNVSEGK